MLTEPIQPKPLKARIRHINHMLTQLTSRMTRGILLCLLLSLQVGSACSQKQDDSECPEDVTLTVEGYLRLMGNEPFVRTAVITDDDERYYLHADQEVIDAMWNARSRLEITGRCLEDPEHELPGRYIEIRSWEPATDP